MPAKTLPISTDDQAPAFTLPDQNGTLHTLSDYEGQWVVLYFYPKALTPGCTIQAKAARDHEKEFKALKTIIIGISADPQEKLAKFAEKHTLRFPLLGDTSHNMLEAYGMWQEKSMFGKKYMGVMRSTVIINPEGKIAYIIKKASPSTHHQDIIDWLKTHAHQTAA